MTETSRIVGVFPGGAIDEFTKWTRTIEAVFGEGMLVESSRHGMIARTPGAVCGCATCDARDRAAIADATERFVGAFMICCPKCGNKRCPRATHHDNACTGSNDSGQTGSRYQ